MAPQTGLDLERCHRNENNFRHLEVALSQHFKECYYSELKDRLFVLSDVKRMPGSVEAKIHFQCSLSLNNKSPKIYSSHAVKVTHEFIHQHELLQRNIQEAEQKIANCLNYASQVRIRLFVSQSETEHSIDQIDFQTYFTVALCATTTMALILQIINSLKEIKEYFLRSDKLNQTNSSMMS